MYPIKCQLFNEHKRTTSSNSGLILKNFILIFLTIILSLLAHNVSAEITPIESIILHTTEGETKRINTPVYLEQFASEATNQHWDIELPASLINSLVPTLLIPQPIQGGLFKINDILIYDLPSSDSTTLRNWYKPIVISIRPILLNKDTTTTLQVEQRGHLTGWSIGPMLVGELNQLRPLTDSYLLISQTLTVAVGHLSVFFGIFLLIVGIKTNNKLLQHSSSVILIWSLLVTLVYLAYLPSKYFTIWRISIYLLSSTLVYKLLCFLCEMIKEPLSNRLRVFIIFFLIVNLVFFLSAGSNFESFTWLEFLIAFYFFTSLYYITLGIIKKKYKSIMPYSIHWSLASSFTMHDYLLHSGKLTILVPQKPIEIWMYLYQQPVYLTHLTLPAFITIAIWIHVRTYLDDIKLKESYKEELRQQRERITRDIHDGVGSRLNLLIWEIREKSALSQKSIENELHHCLDELRFAINPIDSGYRTLSATLTALCSRLSKSRVTPKIHLEIIDNEKLSMPTDMGLQLYRVTQEIINNALKHSNASKFGIKLITNNKTINLQFTDNGCGIANWDNEHQSLLMVDETKLGITGLKRRIQSLGGQISIISSPKGTEIHITAQW